jgi:hypothetical protein
MKNFNINRWVWIGMSAIGVAVCAVFSTAAPVPGESCGLGLPPGAPGFKEAQERERAEVRKNGYVRVCDANLGRFDIAFESMAKASEALAFAPVALARTPFAQFKSVGGMAEKVNGVRSRFYRGFATPDGRRVTLFEHDMSADGTSLRRDPEDEPERVNGLPARLSVMQGRGGDAVSHLSWREGRRFYELWIDANVAGTPLRQELFALAASLPKSIPACPNEIPPKKVVMGPDGMPEIEPMPAVLTDAEMNALIADIERRNDQATRCRGDAGAPSPAGSPPSSTSNQ